MSRRCSRASSQLGDGEQDRTIFAEVVNSEDVGMGQRRNGSRFAFEPRARDEIRGDSVGQHLDATSRSSRVSRPRHLAQTARSDRDDDHVGTRVARRRQEASGVRIIARCHESAGT